MRTIQLYANVNKDTRKKTPVKDSNKSDLLKSVDESVSSKVNEEMINQEMRNQKHEN